MDTSDFMCWSHSSGVSLEGGVAFSWAVKAIAMHMEAEVRSTVMPTVSLRSFLMDAKPSLFGGLCACI